MNSLQNIIKAKAIESGVEYLPSYSGRRMHNHSCIGLAGARGDCIDVIKAVLLEIHNEELDCGNDDTDYDFESALHELLDYDQDSMGLGVILYWCGMQEDQGRTNQSTNLD